MVDKFLSTGTHSTGGQFYLKAEHEEPQYSSTDPGVAVVPGVNKVRGEMDKREEDRAWLLSGKGKTTAGYPAAQE